MVKPKKKIKAKKEAAEFPQFNLRHVDENLLDSDIEELLSELEENLMIDEHGLDEACQTHPELYYRVSKHLALQISRRDAAKQHLMEVEAIADKEIRSQNSEVKLTEREIDSRKIRHPAVRDAHRNLLRLTHQAAQLTALKESYQQRSYVLKSMIELYLSNYFSEISVSGSERDVKESKAISARKAMSDMRRGKK